MEGRSDIRTCLIIGAGMAGLTAADALAKHGIRVTILEKARGVGGRMAYRIIKDGRFDHGAQFITAKNDIFKSRINGWLKAGVIKEWSQGFPRSDGKPVPDHFPHYCGAGSMSDIPKKLAEELDVRTGIRAISLCSDEGCWEAATENGERFRARALVLTPPVPQSLALLDAGGFALPAIDRDSLENIDYDPCISVMALLDGPSMIPEPGGLRMPGEPLEWIADSRMKGISPEAHGITLHAGPVFSRSRYEEKPDRIAEVLLENAKPWIGSKVLEVQVHRWRYSRPVRFYPKPMLALDSTPPLVFAGDAFQGSRVEGAALSGLAAAEYLLARMA